MGSESSKSTPRITLRPPPPSQTSWLPCRTGLHIVWSPDRSAVGQSVYLQPGGNATIGRDPASVTLAIGDHFLSSRHVALECVHDSAGIQRWTVTDVNSLNGIFVNGRRCPKEALVRGDVLRVGATLCVLDVVPERRYDQETMGMVGLSLAISEVREQVRRIAKSEDTALIFGETGCGKELVARAIHDQSARSSKPFLAQNCAAINKDLTESELFGHIPHAFTGAAPRGALGYFRSADGGTLFLDEIDKATPQLQNALLRVLETKKIYPIGSSQEYPVNVRVLAAANRDLLTLVEKEEFRRDLYYRLNHAHVDVPLLRDRRVDIPGLFEHFLSEKIPGGFQTILDSDPSSMWYIADLLEKLCCFNWPGNVRELRNEASHTVMAVTTSQERGTIPLVSAPEICLSRHVAAFRRIRDTLDASELDPEKVLYYQKVYGDPVLLQDAIDTEGQGNVKRFAELSAPYLRKSWEGARRLIYRTLPKKGDGE